MPSLARTVIALVAAMTVLAVTHLFTSTRAEHPEMFELPLHVEGDIPEGRILHTLTAISGNRALLIGGLNQSSGGTVGIADSIYLLTLQPGTNGAEPRGVW